MEVYNLWGSGAGQVRVECMSAVMGACVRAKENSWVARGEKGVRVLLIFIILPYFSSMCSIKYSYYGRGCLAVSTHSSLDGRVLGSIPVDCC